ncbi:FAD-linked oxidoreductase-like protein [Polychytrium aggregatum]|uniref:FAD-linked oxidoreductase-like protein n=1 Tax=Polychytrium aggregatum TaxID=110093 RepID=UPI0022FDDEE5|nr:FAD-linked oxidoreductase-like protein [Polychytrium aggregatum]KAI9209070.1 FAD-linked oxidoreductase-like protein [Polychytrium aggregatum]
MYSARGLSAARVASKSTRGPRSGRWLSSSSALRTQEPSANNARPYKDKSTIDLINSMMVFRLCTVPKIAEISAPILDTAQKANVHAPIYWGIKNTFFKHFCGGENIEEVLPTMEKFKKNGIGSILDLAMEADENAPELVGAEAKAFTAHVAQMMKESIDIAKMQPDSFIAAKITALVPPAVLQRWSNSIRALRTVFDACDADKDGQLNAAELAAFLQRFPSLSAASFPLAARTGRPVDWIDVTDTFTITNAATRTALLGLEPLNSHKDFRLATEQDFATSDLVVTEIDSMFEHARQTGVRIFVDAEQTYFQPAIDDYALYLSKKFNPRRSLNGPAFPIVYNTYQCYLKDTYSRLSADMIRSERGDYSFACKIVRGAYMVSERERAKEFSYEDPINPNIEATHQVYNSAIEFLISKIQSTAAPEGNIPVAFVVASHNKGSVAITRKLMDEYKIERKENRVGFAQLMGMNDSTTYGLAGDGYKVYKYVPYGPVSVTIPYLLRRAQENSSLLGGVAEDRKTLSDELVRRLTLK